MIYVRGVNHNSQHRGVHHNVQNANALEALVRQIHVESAIAVLAEEFSIEACDNESVEESLCCSLARELGIVHLYCDPTSEERKAIGIPSREELMRQVRAERGCKIIMGEDSLYYDKKAAQYHSHREKFWLARIGAARSTGILFVCGADHVESFCALLLSSGWDAMPV